MEQAQRSRMIEIPAGSATLGLSRADTGVFGWDNEYESKTVGVPEFAIDQYKVTNGQYLEFIAAGGYDDRAGRKTGISWRHVRRITVR